MKIKRNEEGYKMNKKELLLGIVGIITAIAAITAASCSIINAALKSVVK